MEELRQEVEKEIIHNRRNDIKIFMKKKRKYAVISNRLEVLTHVLLLVTSILSFISSELYSNWFCFSNGIVCVVCAFLTRLTVYYNDKSKEKNKMLNDLLNKLGLESTPDVVGDVNIRRNNTPEENL